MLHGQALRTHLPAHPELPTLIIGHNAELEQLHLIALQLRLLPFDKEFRSAANEPAIILLVIVLYAFEEDTDSGGVSEIESVLYRGVHQGGVADRVAGGVLRP